MKMIARIIGAVALLGTIVPPSLYLAGSIDLNAAKWGMLVATIVWFLVAPIVDSQTPGEKIMEDAGQETVI